MSTPVIVSETVRQERGESIHTIHIKAAPPKIVAVDGVECYIDGNGHPRANSGPAKHHIPGTYLYWMYLERWDMLPNRPKCDVCNEHHIAPPSKCPTLEVPQ